jgi:hypothetical protein
MNTINTFTYTISSTQGTGTLCNNTIINIGPLRENYDNYYVQCVGFSINSTSLVSPSGYYHLVCDDFAENGYYGLKNNQCILGTLSTSVNIGTMTTGEGSHFMVKNMRSQRQIRFSLYGADMLPVPDGELQNTTYWCAMLLFTPIF